MYRHVEFMIVVSLKQVFPNNGSGKHLILLKTPTSVLDRIGSLQTLSYSKNAILSSCVQFLPMGETFNMPFRNSIKVPLKLRKDKPTDTC